MPNIKPWILVPENSDFSIYNLPFGIFSTTELMPRVGVAIGSLIIDMAGLAEANLIQIDPEVLKKDSLNDFIRLGKKVTGPVRLQVQQLLADPESPLKDLPRLFVKQTEATMHLPELIVDYTDF